MKKLVFALMAAMVMSFAFMACSQKKTAGSPEEVAANVTESLEAITGEPEDQMKEVITFFAETMKATHIKSEADLETLKTLLKAFTQKMQAIQTAVEKKMEGMSDEDKFAYAGKMMGLAKELGSFEDDVQKETERLKSEAEALGLDIEKLGLDEEEAIENAEEAIEKEK